MLYSSLCLLLCSQFVDQTSGYLTDLGTLPTFSDWAVIPYTIATFGRVVYKDDGRCFLRDARKNLAPEGEQLEYFKLFLKTSDVYVDKSPFITEILDDSNRVIRILRPKKWGKTLNLNMLEKFLEIEVDDKGIPLDPKLKRNHEMFCGPGSKQLKICNNKNSMRSFGKHPVVSISLKGIRGKGYKEIELGIRDRLTTTFQKHWYLKRYYERDSNDTLLGWGAMKDRIKTLMEGEPHTIDMLCSIQSLSELLYNHHGNTSKIYLIIDDFDSPVMNAYAEFGHNKTEFRELLEFMEGFLSMGLNDNEYLEKAIITGTYHLFLDDDFMGFNNIVEYNLLQDVRYAKYFGFSQTEVQDVLAKSKISIHASQVEQWYGGYSVAGNVSVYNPASIMKFISQKGKFEQYTVQTVAEDTFVHKILSSDEIKTALKKSLNEELAVGGDEADMEVDPEKDYISKSIVLLCNGIFTPTLIDLEKDILRLKLPNEEVKQFVKKVVE